jgi:hypothetical protein
MIAIPEFGNRRRWVARERRGAEPAMGVDYPAEGAKNEDAHGKVVLQREIGGCLSNSRGSVSGNLFSNQCFLGGFIRI